MSATQGKLSRSNQSRLSDDTKQVIRDALDQLSQMPGFRPRASQRTMIAEVAKTLTGTNGGENILCVEGPTGTGKSLGYLIPAIPVARQRGKSLVISTATVALQEQLVCKDLPEMQARSGMDFTYTLAKGRQRYVCDRNLARLAGSTDAADDAVPASWGAAPDAADLAVVSDMLRQREAGLFDGDLDAWAGAAISPALRSQLVTNSAGCTGRACPYRSQCAFYQAFDARKEFDVIVANHALVVADMNLGGGAILPAPDECIYIFDEGHHLPDTVVHQGAAQTRLVSPQSWLTDVMKLADQVRSATADNRLADAMVTPGDQLAQGVPRVVEALGDVFRYLSDAHPAVAPRPDVPDDHAPHGDPMWLFPLGVVPDHLRTLFGRAADTVASIRPSVETIGAAVRRGLATQPDDSRLSAALSNVQFLRGRLDNMHEAFSALSHAVIASAFDPPMARWVAHDADNDDFLCAASPVSGADSLRSRLWNECDGAIITSATLASLGRFDTLFEQAGLGGSYGTHALILPSPFDYRTNAVLSVPDLPVAPTQSQAHTEAIIALINDGLLADDTGALVLFSSYYQMNAVANGLSPELRSRTLVQSRQRSKQSLLAEHCRTIDEGASSILFGVSSFAEGVDLPGAYCTHVVIAKIPFSVPSSPVDATYSDWLQANKRNPFMEVSVPHASFKLVQAVGRLLRTESDTGQVTILDRRLRDKPYGRRLLNALPPFRRVD